MLETIVVLLVRLMLIVHVLRRDHAHAETARVFLHKIQIGRFIERRDHVTRHWGVGMISEQELFARALSRRR